MDPRIKTFFKLLLGGAAVGLAGVLADPTSYEAFGALATVFLAAGQFIANLLEKLGPKLWAWLF